MHVIHDILFYGEQWQRSGPDSVGRTKENCSLLRDAALSSLCLPCTDPFAARLSTQLQLIEAMKTNKSITQVDLASNGITDEGALAIAGALGAGGAPELISLDLRDNPLTAKGLTILVCRRRCSARPLWLQ